jgi:hypothetical protein
MDRLAVGGSVMLLLVAAAAAAIVPVRRAASTDLNAPIDPFVKLRVVLAAC